MIKFVIRDDTPYYMWDELKFDGLKFSVDVNERCNKDLDYFLSELMEYDSRNYHDRFKEGEPMESLDAFNFYVLDVDYYLSDNDKEEDRTRLQKAADEVRKGFVDALRKAPKHITNIEIRTYNPDVEKEMYHTNFECTVGIDADEVQILNELIAKSDFDFLYYDDLIEEDPNFRFARYLK